MIGICDDKNKKETIVGEGNLPNTSTSKALTRGSTAVPTLARFHLTPVKNLKLVLIASFFFFWELLPYKTSCLYSQNRGALSVIYLIKGRDRAAGSESD
jgi:hypothetical protein